MAQNISVGGSGLEREADHIDRLMSGDQGGESAKKTRVDASGSNNPSQVEQDSRVEKAKADARATGGGPDKPEDGLNQDG